ncbi:MAG TPA: trypsin-like peptidase domain-containing protein [Kofleriaceae bacterium]|nr:trypsin-like peptidase domain-containing protein [Kofleriaceae bacterium]
MRFVMRLACAIGFGLVMVTRLAAAAPASPQQEIALIAKPSVVRVWGAYIATYEVLGNKIQKAIGGSGTGFFITGDGYIATNAHVVTNVHDGDDKAKEALLRALLQEIDKKSNGQLSKLTKAQFSQFLDSIQMKDFQKRAYVVLPNGDRLDYEVKEIGKAGTGRDCALIKVKTSNAPTLPIGDSSKSQVEDHIVVLGYPGVADSEWLLDEKSQLQASVTDGAISSLKRAASGEQILQISAPITHGNSGGPAIDQRGNVVGLATFGNDGDVQGFNFLVASATLLELVKDAKIEPKPSLTSEAWHAGLVHYWADEYTEAISKFEDVETLYPAHSEAANLIRLSHQAQKDGKEKQPPSNTGLIAGLVIGGVALIGAVILIVRRGRARSQAPAGPPAAYGAPLAYGAPPGGPQPGPQPLPMYGRVPPQAMPQQPQQQMYGRVPSPSAGTPIPKTVAIGGGIAPTAFGSLSVGSVTCTRGQLLGQRFSLTATGIIVGRQPGVAHVLVNDHRASGKHVWIGIENGVLVAIDQNTTNGTYINDVARGRITRSALRDGDVIIVGEPDCLSLQVRLG